MSRFQISINVSDVEAAVGFYSSLFGIEPVKHQKGYANFVVADPPLKLIVIEGEGDPGTLNHVGIEVDGTEVVVAATQRLAELGLPFKVDDTHTCCFATQDKVWTQDPDGVPWETYTVLEDAEQFGARAPLMVREIDRDELVAKVADPSVRLLDAQAPGWYEQERLPGAVRGRFDDPDSTVAELGDDLEGEIVVYCWNETCTASALAAKLLEGRGYRNVRRYTAGKQDWLEAGLPIESDA